MWPEASSPFRLAPYEASKEEDFAPVYALTQTADGAYSKSVAKWISRDKDCYTYEEVAEYYSTFRDFPPNYSMSKYPDDGDRTMRRISEYDTSSYHSDSYIPSLGSLRDSPATYYELDIDLTGSYNAGAGKYTRGKGRVVIVEGGLDEEGYETEPAIYFTLNHYGDFAEYYNYAGGFSSLFTGLESGKNSVSDAERVVPTTLDL